MTTFPLSSALPGSGSDVPLSSDEQAFQDRVREFSASFPALAPFQLWLVQQIVRNSMTVDRCRREEAFHQARLQKRAHLCWNDDRRLEAETIAARLPKTPAKTLRALQSTVQGCEWLIERWDCLAQLMKEKGEWTPAQDSLARDMLGIPLELRDVPNLLDAGTPEETRAARQRVAENEIERLARRCHERLESLDALEQAAAARGQSVAPDKALLDCRRLEATANRRIQWALDLLLSAEVPDTSERASAPTPAAPGPPPAPTPASTPLAPELDDYEKYRPVAPSPQPRVATPPRMSAAPSPSSARPERPMNRHERRAEMSRSGR